MTVRSDVLQATYFADKADAVYVAASNQRHEEDGWTYVVVTRGIYSFVQVRDEDGILLGYL